MHHAAELTVSNHWECFTRGISCFCSLTSQVCLDHFALLFIVWFSSFSPFPSKGSLGCNNQGSRCADSGSIPASTGNLFSFLTEPSDLHYSLPPWQTSPSFTLSSFCLFTFFSRDLLGCNHEPHPEHGDSFLLLFAHCLFFLEAC